MRRYPSGIFTILALLLLASGMFSPANAQFGFGVGGWGDHFGTWFGVYPGYYPHYSYRSRPSRPKAVKVENGILEGRITLRLPCAEGQPSLPCPSGSEQMNRLTLAAEPYGSKQWIAGRPDIGGHYQLSLPPGGYNILAQHPGLPGGEKVLRQVIIQPGQTARQDFQVDLTPPVGVP